MALPNIGVPEFFTEIPSTKQKVKYRPFTVKEQKVLLIAIESNEKEDIINATETIVKNCVNIDDISKLAYFDIEWLFLCIRGKSMGEDFVFRMRHGPEVECDHVTEISFNLDDIKFEVTDEQKNTVMITDDMGLELKYPKLVNIQEFLDCKENPGKLIEFICNNISFVFDKDQVYDSFTKDEMVKFVESMSTKQFEVIVKWYASLPIITHKIEWTCPKCGMKDSAELRGLNDFFA